MAAVLALAYDVVEKLYGAQVPGIVVAANSTASQW